VANTSWLSRLIAAVNAEYERRIRRASLVTEYGAHHHEDEGDDDGAVIVNVPPGTAVPRPSPTPPAE
jgi:hypothetical protein